MQLEIIHWIQSVKSPLLDSFFEAVTMTGEEEFFLLLIALIFWCVNKGFGYKLAFSFLINICFNGVLKEFLKVPRPIGQPGVISERVHTATGHAFPSGHTQNSVAFWEPIMMAVRKRWAYILGTLMIILVAFSRVYLGLHWPTDVIGAIVIGTCIVLLCNTLFDYAKQRKNKYMLLCIVIPVVAGAFIFYEENYIKVAGALLGFFLGYCIEDGYIHYNEKGPLFQQILKFFLGFAILMGLKSGLKMILPSHMISELVRYVIIGLWITVGAPYIFQKMSMTSSRGSNMIRH